MPPTPPASKQAHSPRLHPPPSHPAQLHLSLRCGALNLGWRPATRAAVLGAAAYGFPEHAGLPLGPHKVATPGLLPDTPGTGPLHWAGGAGRWAEARAEAAKAAAELGGGGGGGAAAGAWARARAGAPAAFELRLARALLVLRVAGGWADGPHRSSAPARYCFASGCGDGAGEAAGGTAGERAWLPPQTLSGHEALASLLPTARELCGGGHGGGIGGGGGAAVYGGSGSSNMWPWEGQLMLAWRLAEVQSWAGPMDTLQDRWAVELKPGRLSE